VIPAKACASSHHSVRTRSPSLRMVVRTTIVIRLDFDNAHDYHEAFSAIFSPPTAWKAGTNLTYRMSFISVRLGRRHTNTGSAESLLPQLWRDRTGSYKRSLLQLANGVREEDYNRLVGRETGEGPRHRAAVAHSGAAGGVVVTFLSTSESSCVQVVGRLPATPQERELCNTGHPWFWSDPKVRVLLVCFSDFSG
jgi:hypothetical protein